ncbi:Bestrophin -like protein [Caligus rogercresseyi]|uniref:Bestrophin homolog n=1 Tax=Caligus rogercresseyi TaxID=217165 RepID=A0A7T8HIY6_CALRO|nr:Bestrophin -like protein [Caligus rogercresseyi]
MSYGRNLYANQYQDTSKRCRGSFYLFAVWKNSVFKLIWHEFLIFFTLYFFISFLYRVIIFDNPESRALFEMLCVFASRFMHQIPITFLTGFYVSQQFMTLPWPDKIALKLVTFVPGKTLIDAKLMLPHEAERLEKIDAKTPHESSWTPLLWANKLLQKARSEGKITIEPPLFGNLISSFDFVDTANRKILNYGLVNFPLAYTQVAVFSVYCYFLASLFGKQYLIPNDSQINEVAFPHNTPRTFSFLSYLCGISELRRVDQRLLHQLHNDRNLQVSYLIVDVADNDFEMAKDPFLEAGIDVPPMPPHVPTPTGSLKRKKKTSICSVDKESAQSNDCETPSPNKSLYMTILSGDSPSPTNETKLIHHESTA